MVIRTRRARDGPVVMNAFVVKGDANFGIVGESLVLDAVTCRSNS